MRPLERGEGSVHICAKEPVRVRRELGSTCGPAGAHLSTSLEAVLEGPVDSHRLETAPRPSASLFLPRSCHQADQGTEKRGGWAGLRRQQDL